MEEKLGKEKTRALMKYGGVVSLTKEDATYVLKTVWPRAPEVEIIKAALICSSYGLNPLMKHLFLIPFKKKGGGEDWVPVLGINANRLMAQRRHHYSYLDLTPRRMNDEEQKKIFGEIDDSRIWAITKLKDMETGAEVMGIGSWPRDEVPYGADKGNTKLNMACIRSERQALDRQYPGEMPQGIAVADEEYLEGEIVEGEAVTLLDEKGAGTNAPTEKAETKPKTGTIKKKKATSEAEIKFGAETEWEELESEKRDADAANFSEAETRPKPARASAPAEPARYEPKQLSNIGDLMHAANQRWGLAPSEVERKLGKSRLQFTDLLAEWNELKTRMEQGEYR